MNIPIFTLSPNGQAHPALPSPPTLPEAPCSVNHRFTVHAPGDSQATGRGTTPDEAARNLVETVAAARAALAPPPTPEPPSPEVRCRGLVERALIAAARARDWVLSARVLKAESLVLAGHVGPTDSPAILAVQSQAHPGTWYEVTRDTMVCTCEDWTRHGKEKGYRCKHGLAAALWTKLQEPGT